MYGSLQSPYKFVRNPERGNGCQHGAYPIYWSHAAAEEGMLISRVGMLKMKKRKFGKVERIIDGIILKLLCVRFRNYERKRSKIR